MARFAAAMAFSSCWSHAFCNFSNSLANLRARLALPSFVPIAISRQSRRANQLYPVRNRDNQREAPELTGRFWARWASHRGSRAPGGAGGGPWPQQAPRARLTEAGPALAGFGAVLGARQDSQKVAWERFGGRAVPQMPRGARGGANMGCCYAAKRHRRPRYQQPADTTTRELLLLSNQCAQASRAKMAKGAV